MLTITADQRRWLIVFGLALASFLGLVLWSNSRLTNFRDPPFDFRAMTPDELFVVDGLTRRQEGSVKLGFAEACDPPEIGSYGNHIARYFGSDAFGRAGDNSYFFNYWFANLALPEIYRYLRQIELLGRLPKRLILVQITSPNIDNGLFVINFGHELPPDLLRIGSEGGTILETASSVGDFAWQVTENWLHETLNYSTFLLGFGRREDRDRVIDPTRCRTAEDGVSLQEFVRFAPQIVRDFLANYVMQGDFCRRAYWTGAIRRDGSTDAKYAHAPLILDEYRLDEKERGLNSGDESEIAGQMRAIAALGARHGVKVAFVVPPAFESNRDDSVVNQVFNRALALAPELTVIDHRQLRSDPSLFVDYRHPSPKYFRLLADELRRRGVI